MDKKFLNKVIDQIVSETIIDHDKETIRTPFSFINPNSFVDNALRRLIFTRQPSPFIAFVSHCRDVYGLNLEETEYVWNEYRRIIKDKIENNGI